MGVKRYYPNPVDKRKPPPFLEKRPGNQHPGEMWKCAAANCKGFECGIIKIHCARITAPSSGNYNLTTRIHLIADLKRWRTNNSSHKFGLCRKLFWYLHLFRLMRDEN